MSGDALSGGWFLGEELGERAVITEGAAFAGEKKMGGPRSSV